MHPVAVLFIGHKRTVSTEERSGPPRMRAVSLDRTGEETQKRVTFVPAAVWEMAKRSRINACI